LASSLSETGALVAAEVPASKELSEDLEEVAAPEEPDWVVLDNGEAALDAAEASVVAAEIGATVILLAGTQGAGKTTLLVELYAQFLEGPCAGLRFAGSKTLDALDYRHFASRLDSGNERAVTERTGDTDMRLLHLRLSDGADNHQALMFSDVKGEVFEELINGLGTVGNLVPLAWRADKTILLVDGETIADPATRQTATLQARLLIGTLAQPSGLRKHNQLLIALSKRDLLDDAAATWYETEAQALDKHARERGLSDVRHLEIAARPNNNARPTGLVEVLGWMWAPVTRPPVTNPTITAQSTRVFLTGTTS
jgi:hypothetical protein